MSRALKRKHNMRDYYDFSPPTGAQQIVKIIKSAGNNLHEVETVGKTRFLVSMPTRFRKNIWVKRGGFVIIEPIAEGVKVKGEIVRILTNDHIKYYKEDKIWPSDFDAKESEKRDNDEETEIPENTNRKSLYVDSYDSENSDDSDYSEDDDSESENDCDNEK